MHPDLKPWEALQSWTSANLSPAYRTDPNDQSRSSWGGVEPCLGRIPAPLGQEPHPDGQRDRQGRWLPDPVAALSRRLPTARHRRRDRRSRTSRCHHPKGHPRDDPANLHLHERHPRTGQYHPAGGWPQLSCGRHIHQWRRLQSARPDRPDEHMARALQLLRLETLQNASGGGRVTSGRRGGGGSTCGMHGGEWRGERSRVS